MLESKLSSFCFPLNGKLAVPELDGVIHPVLIGTYLGNWAMYLIYYIIYICNYKSVMVCA